MMEGVSARRRRAWRGTSSSPTCAGSTTATTSRSRAAPISPSTRTSACASTPMAGTSSTWTTPTTPPPSPKAIETFKTTDDRPTFIVVHSVIGWGSPKIAGSEKAHGEPLGVEDVIAATKRAYGWPEDKQFYVPDGVAEAFRGCDRRPRRRSCARSGRRLLGATVPRSPISPPSSTCCSTTSFPMIGTPTSPSSPPTPRASPAATPAARCSTPSSARCPG